MKKFLSLFVFISFFTCLATYAAGLDGVLNSINSTLNTIDRIENTQNRVKNQVKRNPNSQSTESQTPTNYPTYNGNSYNNYPTTNNYPATNGTYTYPAANTNYNYSENTPMELYGDYNQTLPQGMTEEAVRAGNYNYSQTKTYRDDINTLGGLPQGALLMDPKSVWNFRTGRNYSGEITVSHPVFWKKLEDNHYQNGATLLLSDFSVAEYPFCHSQKGIRAWNESDVRRFLRTTFYNHLSTGFQNAIVNVTIPYADLSGHAQTVTDNLFLLSIVEWGLSDRGSNGKAIKYPNLPNTYAMGSLEYNKTDNYYNVYYYSSAENLTRTINRPKASSAGYTSDVFLVEAGALETSSFSYPYYKVRPAVNLKSSTRVQGPYKFEYGSKYSRKALIYYILAF